VVTLHVPRYLILYLIIGKSACILGLDPSRSFDRGNVHTNILYIGTYYNKESNASRTLIGLNTTATGSGIRGSLLGTAQLTETFLFPEAVVRTLLGASVLSHGPFLAADTLALHVGRLFVLALDAIVSTIVEWRRGRGSRCRRCNAVINIVFCSTWTPRNIVLFSISLKAN